jgi:DNA repair exonuclease SbcCD nuclease subunit
MDPLVIRLPFPEVNFVYTTDWHLTDIAPGARTGNYVEEILAKVAFTSELTRTLNGIGLCGGDVFHVKNPDSKANSFSLERKLSLAMQRFPQGRVYGAIGNHDLWQDRMDSLPKQPLGSIIASGVYHDLSAQHVIFENEDASVRVLVEALPYHENDGEALEAVLARPERPADVTHRILLMHQYGHTGGESNMFGHRTIGYDELAEADYDVMLWGHDHSREKTVRVGNVLHIRLGSLARAAFAHDEIDRPIAAAALSFSSEKVKFREHVIPVKPLELAFVAAHKTVEKVHIDHDVSAFFETLGATVDAIETSDPREVVHQLCAGDREVEAEILQACGL